MASDLLKIPIQQVHSIYIPRQCVPRQCTCCIIVAIIRNTWRYIQHTQYNSLYREFYKTNQCNDQCIVTVALFQVLPTGNEAIANSLFWCFKL